MSAAPHAIPAKKWKTVPDRVIERVRDHVAMGPKGCWISTYSVANHGYAQVGWHDENGRWVTLCHRVIWIAEHGPIPDGMTVDHLCNTRRCFRPDHLRLLDNLQNARRTEGRDWELGRCINGHPDAQYWRSSGPSLKKGYCTACAANARRRYRAKKNAAMAGWQAAKRTGSGPKRPCRRTDRGESA